jgi:hypothetical protein
VQRGEGGENGVGDELFHDVLRKTASATGVAQRLRWSQHGAHRIPRQEINCRIAAPDAPRIVPASSPHRPRIVAALARVGTDR